MESSTTPDIQQYTKEQQDLHNMRDQREKTLADYYAKKLRYYDFSHIVKNISE